MVILEGQRHAQLKPTEKASPAERQAGKSAARKRFQKTFQIVSRSIQRRPDFGQSLAFYHGKISKEIPEDISKRFHLAARLSGKPSCTSFVGALRAFMDRFFEAIESSFFGQPSLPASSRTGKGRPCGAAHPCRTFFCWYRGLVKKRKCSRVRKSPESTRRKLS